MSTESTEVLITPEGETVSPAFGNRFLLVVVASQRAVQIRDGSRPRVDPGSHKPSVLAVAEVLAGCVPYLVS